MKQISFLKYSILALILSFGIVGCSSDDNEKILISEDVIATTLAINQDALELQKLYEVVSTTDQLETVDKKESHTELHFTSGRTIVINNNKVVNSNIPSLSFEQDEDQYYWTVWYKGEKQWVKSNGKRVPLAVVQSGRTYPVEPYNIPLLVVSENNEWVFDVAGVKELFKDKSGIPVEATADSKVSLFQSVNLSNGGEVEVELIGGFKALFERSDISISFVMPEDNLPRFFAYEESIEVDFTFENLSQIQPGKLISGWSIEVNEEAKKVKITAPKGDKDEDSTEGAIQIKGVDKNGIEITAEYPVYTLDMTHPHGTFIVIEGNMTSENGTFVFYDQYAREHADLYETANNSEHGNVVQDIYIANNKVYIINQNGPQQSGDDRFAIINPRTAVKEYSHPMSFVSDEGVAVWPQHMVVVEDKLFLQYATSDMELSSGIRVFDLNSKTLAPKDIEGTYGEFTNTGALKGRMQLSRGKIYAGLGKGVVIIDAATAKVTKTVMFKGQVKGLVKGADNNFHIAVSGEYSGHPNMTSPSGPSKMVGMDHEGNILYDKVLSDEVSFPIATWSPSVNMAASFTKPHIYLVTKSDFSVTSASRFNYETKTMESDIISADNNLYGYIGVHPITEAIYVGATEWYMNTIIYKYSVDKTSNKLSFDSEIEYSKASPAGIDFGYRFSKEFVER